MTSFSNVFLTGRVQHHNFKSQPLKIENLALHGLAGGKLSLQCKYRNCVGLREEWQLVTLAQLFLSSKNKKKKDVNEPVITSLTK